MAVLPVLFRAFLFFFYFSLHVNWRGGIELNKRQLLVAPLKSHVSK
jgi:hypothetical protein